MKKFIGLTSYALVIAAEILSVPAFAENELPLITSKNLHVRNHKDEVIPARTGVQWLEPDSTNGSRSKAVHDQSNQFALISYADRDCVRKQVENIKKVSRVVRELEYQVVINLESANGVKKGSFANARTEQDFCIPLLNQPYNPRKILELGVVVPSPDAKSPSSCVVVDEAAIVQALNRAQPSSCEKKGEETQAKAVTNRSGDKPRAPASVGGHADSESGTPYSSGSIR